MATRIEKTNAIRLLDARNVTYEALGQPVRRVYKTLVVLPEGGGGRPRPYLVMVAGDRELDPPPARAIAGTEVCPDGIAEGCRVPDRPAGGRHRRTGV